MNSFCKYCISGKSYCSDEQLQEIKSCEFKYCPFWPERFADLPYQIEEFLDKIVNKAIKEIPKTGAMLGMVVGV